MAFSAFRSHFWRRLRHVGRYTLGFLAARKEVERRMAAQLPEAEKIKVADYVIDNSGSLEQTREQVRQVWQRLRSEGKCGEP